jgi:GNAT superfamily N-acetyltransferase
VPITVVGHADLAELLPLMRAYCDFYQVAPADQALLELSQALLADPEREGLQLLARDGTGRAVGFATLYWTWQTLAAARVGVMNDLYVAAEARGTGVAEGLIAACLERCREHGASRLVWQTAVDNHRAQAVYERIGATRDDRWLDYQLPVDPTAGGGLPPESAPLGRQAAGERTPRIRPPSSVTPSPAWHDVRDPPC